MSRDPFCLKPFSEHLPPQSHKISWLKWQVLVHWGGDKMFVILQPIYSNSFCLMKTVVIGFESDWNMFPWVQLTTRRTPRAFTFAAPSLRSVKQSSQEWSNLANCLWCHVRHIWKYHENIFILRHATNTDPEDRIEIVYSRCKRKIPNIYQVFLVSDLSW